MYSDPFTTACTEPARLGTAPYDDANLIAYIPQVCPDHVEEAISNDLVTLGNAFDRVDFDGDGIPVMASFGAGVVGYGAQPAAPDGDSPLTIACRAHITEQPGTERTLFEFGGLKITILDDGSGYNVRGHAQEAVGGDTYVDGPTTLAIVGQHDFRLEHDVTGANLRLYLDGDLEASALGTVGERFNFGLYSIQLPPDSWITDCAVWDKVLTAPPLTVTINQGASQSDPATASPIVFDVVFSEAVTGFATGDVTLSGTAGATTATVSGSGASYTVNVTGMTGAGTVIATIAASVCTSVATSEPNQASTSTDNTVTYALGGNLPAAILALSPAGYWKLNEPGGTTALDSSGNGRSGTYTGSGYTLQGASGGDGNTYVDLGNSGSSSHIAIADHNAWSVDTSSGLTVFMLLKPDSISPGTRRIPISKGTGSKYEWGTDCFVNDSLGAAAGRFLCNTWSAAGVRRNGAYSAGDPITTNWNAIAFVLPTTTTTGDVKVYRHGSDITSNLGSSTSNAYVNNDAELRIGWRADSPSPGYWEGGIAHVAIFAGILNSTQIGTLMSAADADGWY
jgi:hypothetical protein